MSHHKMTVNISKELHEELRKSASLDNKGLSKYVTQLLDDHFYDLRDKEEQVRGLIKINESMENKLALWRALAIAFLVGIIVSTLLLGKLNRDYIKLFNEGVPVSEDISMVQYYKSIIANRCKIVEK